MTILTIFVAYYFGSDLCSTDTSDRRCVDTCYDRTTKHIITFNYVIFSSYYQCRCVSASYQMINHAFPSILAAYLKFGD